MSNYSFNRVILVGNLTRDPELRYVPSGTPVSDISLAVNHRYKRNEEWVDETTYVDVTLWARTAEVANEYLSKGSQVLIEGRLKLDTWEKDGQKQSRLRVVADRMMMLGGRGENGGGGNFQKAPMRAVPDDHEAEQRAASTSMSDGPPDQEIPF
ncbi:MAG: single-stranded DNA-binding protein [Pirellulales bacterium]|nr:single-stranded DNA-binding protein [Pirellulales bacterium]